MKHLTMPRKLMMLGAGGLLTVAGLGGVLSHTAHASSVPSAPATTLTATSIDAGTADVQDQVGDQTAPDAAESTAPEAAETAADAPGGPDVQSGPDVQDASGTDSGTNG